MEPTTITLDASPAGTFVTPRAQRLIDELAAHATGSSFDARTTEEVPNCDVDQDIAQIGPREEDISNARLYPKQNNVQVLPSVTVSHEDIARAKQVLAERSMDALAWGTRAALASGSWLKQRGAEARTLMQNTVEQVQQTQRAFALEQSIVHNDAQSAAELALREEMEQLESAVHALSEAVFVEPAQQEEQIVVPFEATNEAPRPAVCTQTRIRVEDQGREEVCAIRYSARVQEISGTNLGATNRSKGVIAVFYEQLRYGTRTALT